MSPLEGLGATGLPDSLAIAVGNIWGRRVVSPQARGLWDDTIPVASVTKPVVALSALLMEADAASLFERSVGEILGLEASWAEATVWDLLSHISGLPFELTPDDWEVTRDISDAEFLDSLDRLRPLPFGGWHYSNLGYAVAAIAMERVSGRPWFHLVRAHLLLPLGAERAHIEPSHTVDLGRSAPAGQLWMTLDDLVSFGCLLAGGREDIAPLSVLDNMLAPRALISPGVVGGLGISVESRGELPRPWSWGVIAGRTTMLLVEPGWGCAVLHGPSDATTGVSDALANVLNSLSSRDRLEDESSGSWWIDGQEIRVTHYGEVTVGRTPAKATPLFVAAKADPVIHREGDLLLWADMVLTRDPARSAWGRDQ